LKSSIGKAESVRTDGSISEVIVTIPQDPPTRSRLTDRLDLNIPRQERNRQPAPPSRW